jgi:hypothetical protein
MIVPEYWAEGRVQRKHSGRQITVRRFGWSDSSQAEAQHMADERTEQAFKQIASGEKLPRREPKIPYGGADGLPIREELLARHGNSVITRNSYGAHCLNTPDVFFADIDTTLSVFPTSKLVTSAVLLVATLTRSINDIHWSTLLLALITLTSLFFSVRELISWLRIKKSGGPASEAMNRIKEFIQCHPDWKLRVYETPAGFRVAALHQRFDPRGPETFEAFEYLATDPIYARMCRAQNCFRARLTAKPWRAGITTPMRPRPGVWPVNPERLHARTQWVQSYEVRAEGFAACRFLSDLGSAAVDPEIMELINFHDIECRSHSTLQLA